MSLITLTPLKGVGRVVPSLPSLSGLVANFDGANTSSMTVDASNNIAQWTDQSSNAFAATASGTDRPTLVPGFLNGLSVVQFSGAQYLAFGTSNVFTNACTIFAVVQTGISGGKYVLNLRCSTPTSLAYMFGTSGYDCGFTSGTMAITPSGVSTNTWYDTYFTYNGSGSQTPANYAYVINGVGQTFSNDGTWVTFNGNKIGATDFGAGASGFLTGYIAQILVYSRVLTGGEITTIESYLASKWGI